LIEVAKLQAISASSEAFVTEVGLGLGHRFQKFFKAQALCHCLFEVIAQHQQTLQLTVFSNLQRRIKGRQLFVPMQHFFDVLLVMQWQFQ